MQSRQAGIMRHRLTSLLATDQEGQTALISAALEGDSKKVRVLLKLGADINTQDGMGRTALMLAVINRHVKIVKALLHNRADVNITTNDGDTALSLAASGGDGAMTKALLDHRAEVRAESAPTSARLATGNGYTGIVRLLQRVGALA